MNFFLIKRGKTSSHCGPNKQPTKRVASSGKVNIGFGKRSADALERRVDCPTNDKEFNDDERVYGQKSQFGPR